MDVMERDLSVMKHTCGNAIHYLEKEYEQGNVGSLALCKASKFKPKILTNSFRNKICM